MVLPARFPTVGQSSFACPTLLRVQVFSFLVATFYSTRNCYSIELTSKLSIRIIYSMPQSGCDNLYWGNDAGVSRLPTHPSDMLLTPRICLIDGRPIYSMYSKIAQEESHLIAEGIQRDGDGILIFVSPHFPPCHCVPQLEHIDWFILRHHRCPSCGHNP